MKVAPAPADPPPGFVRDVYDHAWTIGRPISQVWQWLNDPATFTDGQIPPFRVEFLTNAAGQTGFHEGVYNAHVGPLMSFSGVLGELQHESYRDLQYFYGSYAVSHALFRPVRLQFWVDEIDEGRVTTVAIGRRTFAVSKYEGEVGCLDNACPHQGGPLGEGSIESG